MRKLWIIFVICFEFICAARAVEIEGLEPLQPLPQWSKAADMSKAQLGKKLFFDPRLSKNSTVSCASCHSLTMGGADGRSRSVGIDGALGDINSPSVFNSGFNFRQFWNGRARTLEDQVDGPVEHPKEMGSAWADVIVKLNADPAYVRQFKKIYDSGVTRANVKDSIASFERALTTPNSAFDRFLLGQSAALTPLEKSGYRKFKSFGCVACHQGMNVGGNMFQTMGVMGNYFKDRGTPITDADLGRFTVTKVESDRHVFRVPSLRNVALTAPYFHDGSAKNLEDAVGVMAKYQLGRKLSADDLAAIVAFLKTLTGELPEIARDRLPAGEP